MPAKRPWQNQRVQIGMLGPLEVRADAGGLVDVPGQASAVGLSSLAMKIRLVPRSWSRKLCSGSRCIGVVDPGDVTKI